MKVICGLLSICTSIRLMPHKKDVEKSVIFYIYLRFTYFIVCVVSVFPACIYMHHVYTVQVEVRRVCWTPCNWSGRCFWTTVWINSGTLQYRLELSPAPKTDLTWASVAAVEILLEFPSMQSSRGHVGKWKNYTVSFMNIFWGDELCSNRCSGQGSRSLTKCAEWHYFSWIYSLFNEINILN